MEVVSAQHPRAAAVAAQLKRPEVLTQSGFSHKNLVRVFDVGVLRDGRPFFVIERLVGRTLREELAASGRLSTPRAIALAAQLAEGLDAAHGAGAVHPALRTEAVF